MSHYELTYILSSAIAETDYPALQKSIAALIVSLGKGSITSEVILGRKKLAYPINKDKYGHYVTVEFDAEADSIKPLDRDLKHNNSCLRHLIISKKVLSPEQQEIEANRQAKVRARKAAAKNVIIPSATAAEPEIKKTSKPKTKITLDKLDEKLDELLGQELK
ncbi:MAG: 30S ribosomal protein S6 [Candidatus Komeilibacteria bacterium]